MIFSKSEILTIFSNAGKVGNKHGPQLESYSASNANDTVTIEIGRTGKNLSNYYIKVNGNADIPMSKIDLTSIFSHAAQCYERRQLARGFAEEAPKKVVINNKADADINLSLYENLVKLMEMEPVWRQEFAGNIVTFSVKNTMHPGKHNNVLHISLRKEPYQVSVSVNGTKIAQTNKIFTRIASLAESAQREYERTEYNSQEEVNANSFVKNYLVELKKSQTQGK